VLNPSSSFRGEIKLTNVIRLAIGRLGHAFDTRLVSPKELNHAQLLGDQVARHSHYSASKSRRSYRLS
jgi:hypothetical protein